MNKPMVRNILWRVTIVFISQKLGGRGGLFRANVRCPEGKNNMQSKLGCLFWSVV